MVLHRVLLVCSYFMIVLQHTHGYGIPTPTIEVFTPKGFRVSIEDSSGIRLFAFHGNINREVKDLETGAIAGDVVNKRNGRWIFRDRRTRLQIGDEIHYWLFVIKDGLGYRLEGKSFTVQELIPKLHNGNHGYPPGNRENSNTCNGTTTLDTDSTENNMDSNLRVCEQTILNVTQVMLSLQNEREKMTRENQQLKNFIDRIPNSKMLTLSGRISPDGEAHFTVSFVLREKLLLNPLIISAHRNSPTNITFEVDTIFEKFEILSAAKERLNASRIIIF